MDFLFFFILTDFNSYHLRNVLKNPMICNWLVSSSPMWTSWQPGTKLCRTRQTDKQHICLFSLCQRCISSCTSEPSTCMVKLRGSYGSKACVTLNLLTPYSYWETWWTRAMPAAETCMSAAVLNWISWWTSVCEYSKVSPARTSYIYHF